MVHQLLWLCSIHLDVEKSWNWYRSCYFIFWEQSMKGTNKRQLAGTFVLGSLLLGLLMSCSSEDSAKEQTAEPTDTATMSIADQLTARREGFKAKAPAAAVEISREAVEEIKKSGLLDRALNVGDTVPPFSLTDALGKVVNISDLLQKGPVVLVFYRGAW